MWAFPLQICSFFSSSKSSSCSSFVFDGSFCPSDQFLHCVTAAAGMSDGFRRQREMKRVLFWKKLYERIKGESQEGGGGALNSQNGHAYEGGGLGGGRFMAAHPILVLQLQ